MAVPVFEGQAPEASAGRAPSVRVKLERALNLRADYEVLPGRAADSRSWDVEFGIGACQLVKRSAFEAVGGFDETYFYGPEDLDVCLRIGDAGYRVVQVRDAHVIHDARRAFRQPFSRRAWVHTKALTRHYVRRFRRRFRTQSS